MKNRSFIIHLLCLAELLFCICAGAQQTESYCVPVRTLKESELAFQAGEKMTFTMHYEF